MKLRPFELVLVIIFIVLAALALILLATFESNNEAEIRIGPVAIWGTLDQAGMQAILDELTSNDEAYQDVTYRQIDEGSFATRLTNALADGAGPDLILISHEQLAEVRRRIAPISYDSFALRDIRNAYIDGAEIFALSDGLYAYPIAVDPLMMYWNRDLLTTLGFLNPPQTWEDVVNTYAPTLTERSFDRTINRSAIAFGEYSNVTNAYGVISMLLIQSGMQGVAENEGLYTVNLNRSIRSGQPLTTSLDFYTRFAKPNNTLYSWNRALPSDRLAFLAEDLALYFGYGSEGVVLERANPNLNFDIAEVPQGAAATVRRTYGKFYGLGLVRNARNPQGASTVLAALASPGVSSRIAQDNRMAPVYRSVLSQGSNGTYERVYYGSAAVSFGWLNPDRSAVDTILAEGIRSVLEGRDSEGGVATDIEERLRLEYN